MSKAKQRNDDPLNPVVMLPKPLLPCPFCGSDNLRIDIMYWDDEGDNPGIECMNCDAIARPENWNNRHANATASPLD